MYRILLKSYNQNMLPNKSYLMTIEEIIKGKFLMLGQHAGLGRRKAKKKFPKKYFRYINSQACNLMDKKFLSCPGSSTFIFPY